MPTKSITVQKIKNSENFEFPLCNNCDATDSSRIFRDFSYCTRRFYAIRSISFLLRDRKKRRVLFSELEDLKQKKRRGRSLPWESRIRREVKMSIKYRRCARVVVEAKIRIINHCVLRSMYRFSLLSSLSLSIFFFSFLCFFALFIRPTIAEERLTADSSVNDVVVGSCPAFVLLLCAPREILRKELLSRFAARLVMPASSNEFPPFLGARSKEETHYKNLPSYSFRNCDMFRRI